MPLDEALLAYVGQELANDGLSYAEPPAALQGGFDTQIYALRLAGAPDVFARPLILRVFRERDAPVRALWEKTVHDTLVALGYPAPRVHLACTNAAVIGRAFVIMERLPGTMMMEEIFKPTKIKLSRIFREVPGALAEAQARLHSLDPQPLVRALDAVPSEALGRMGAGARIASPDGQLRDIEARVRDADLAELAPGARWLLEHAPAPAQRPVICHGDFHPLNVLVDDGAVTGVLDWPMVTVADAAFDVANTRLLLRLAPVPGFLDWLAALVRPLLAQRYYEAYLALNEVDEEIVRYYAAQRCMVELVGVAEKRLARGDGTDSGPNPWDTRRALSRLLHYFRQISGVRLALPSVG